MVEMKLPKGINKAVGMVVNKVTSSVSQTSVRSGGNDYPEIEGIGERCREAARESFVLLKNEHATLPFTEEDTVSVFGRVQYDTFYVGYGSGGDVNPHYRVSINAGIKANDRLHINTALDETYRKWVRRNRADNGYWGHWPTCYDEMHVSEAAAAAAAERSSAALIVIGRAAGEDRENSLEKGSYYLTDEEENLIRVVTLHFERTAVILNVGGVMDLSWVERYNVPCVGLCWQGGMETGNAVADIISGEVSPSGKLTDTIAVSYEACPSAGNFGEKKKNHYEEDIFVGYRYFETFAKDDVLYPFGYGLSYSSFRLSDVSFEHADGAVTVRARIENTGGRAAKETLQLYYSHRGSPLCFPERALAAFRKTALLAPGESEEAEFRVPDEQLAGYDDGGATSFCSAYVLPKGLFSFFLGFDVRSAERIGGFTQERDVCVRQLSSLSAPKKEERLMRLVPVYAGDRIYTSYEPAPTDRGDLKALIERSLPPEIPRKDYEGETLYGVSDGRCEPDALIAMLSDDELEAISRGDYVMNSPLGPTGNAGVFGGVLESLRAKGVTPVTTTDGPSGIRLAADSALLPCGTALACTFSPALVESLYALLGLEMADRGSDVLLAPGMNIHRDPLCGRNFEYFSEDPLLAGAMAAAVIKGLRQAGVSGCMKHFACNNQETNRTKTDSVLSERALREIYLKAFEICVKTAEPAVIMTSYNKINGVWGHYNYPLVNGILRGEWGYKGLVITDWWMQKSASPEFPKLRDQAYRVRAGVDVLMPGGERVGKKEPDGTLLETLGQEGGITRGELQAAAAHVLRFILSTKRFLKEKEIHANETDEL